MPGLRHPSVTGCFTSYLLSQRPASVFGLSAITWTLCGVVETSIADIFRWFAAYEIIPAKTTLVSTRSHGKHSTMATTETIRVHWRLSLSCQSTSLSASTYNISQISINQKKLCKGLITMYIVINPVGNRFLLLTDPGIRHAQVSH